jgi:hypothetical protein
VGFNQGEIRISTIDIERRSLAPAGDVALA